eukprot:gene22624-29767_t
MGAILTRPIKSDRPPENVYGAQRSPALPPAADRTPKAHRPRSGQSCSKKTETVVAEVELDENLHSRQIAVYGREVMKRMASSNILISGANGLGCEIAKNVILAGMRSVTIHDTTVTTLRDLGSQFYLTEADIGKNRAEACKEKLQELNTDVAVSASSTALNEDFLKQFQVKISPSPLSPPSHPIQPGPHF